jgi:hypothetical protein
VTTNGDGAGEVRYTVKELLKMLEETLTAQMSTIVDEIKTLSSKIDSKASELRVEAAEKRVSAIEERLGKLETIAAGAAAVSAFQRWALGTVGVGVLGAIATLVWLASGGH